MTQNDFDRLEDKLDRISTAVEKLVLIEERQNNQTERLNKQEAMILANAEAINRLDSRTEKWAYFGGGAWFIILGAIEAMRIFAKWVRGGGKVLPV